MRPMRTTRATTGLLFLSRAMQMRAPPLLPPWSEFHAGSPALEGLSMSFFFFVSFFLPEP